MVIDLIIVLLYFIIVFVIAISGKGGKDISKEEYFLSSRNLKWYSVAISTIATNVQGYQFLGMAGSAYLYGFAQANFEFNAITGLWMAAFIFVPLYLRDKVYTITQFIKSRMGEPIALLYSVANIILFSTIGLGAALFWGAYAADLVFGDYMSLISEDSFQRITILIIALGLFSAAYTYFGGLSAVVRTDIIQFSILLIGGIVVMLVALHQLGGRTELYNKVPEKMHLHLPANHEKLPWVCIIGLFFLNINYWCANQSIIQRSLAAKSLQHAQVGLLVGGLMKVFMGFVIVIPGIALAGILGAKGLADPDEAFPYLVTNYLPMGIRGIILCALFASLMSTVDSLYNSLATLFSIDIYKGYIKKEASDKEMVAAGRYTILATLFTGILVGVILLNAKLSDTKVSFTHTLNELRYYVNTSIVVIICASSFLLKPNKWLAFTGILLTATIYASMKYFTPDVNYWLRVIYAISSGFLLIAVPTIIKNGFKDWRSYIQLTNKTVSWFGWGLLILLLMIHFVWH